MNFQKYFKKILKDTLKQIGPIGSYQFFLLVIIYFFLLNQISVSLKLLIGLILLYIIAIPIRIIFFKERPKPIKYTNIVEKVIASSMPSLHSARSVFLALFFIDYFHYNYSSNIFFISILLIIFYSRIKNKRHYIIDIIVGAILGIFIWIIINWI